jgi:hypothetical protein
LILKAELIGGKWVTSTLKKKFLFKPKQIDRIYDRMEKHGNLRQRIGMRTNKFYLAFRDFGNIQKFIMFESISGKVNLSVGNSKLLMEASRFEKEISDAAL